MPVRRRCYFRCRTKPDAELLARALSERGATIYATGGTRRYLEERGIEVRDAGQITGFPELFGGRVKTLHPKIFGGILYDRSNPEHAHQAEIYAVPPIDVVAVNLYPFEDTVGRAGVTLDDAIEQIDIGGVALLRAAAKNFAHVSVLTSPSQYQAFLNALSTDGDLAGLRRRLAISAFERTAEYDVAISHYLATAGEFPPSELPGALVLTLPLIQRLRYGTNPQERAAFYLDRRDRLPEQLHGKTLSYNNLLDLDATLRLLSRASLGAEIGSRHERYVRAAVVKHTIPCGVAQRSSVGLAVADALAADSISAFGGIVATDARVDLAAAQTLSQFFLEIVAAPGFDDDAFALLSKKKNLRVMRFPVDLPDELAAELRVRSALGGVLAEDNDPAAPPERWRVVSKKQPGAAAMARHRAGVGRRAPREIQRHRNRQRRHDARHLRGPNESRFGRPNRRYSRRRYGWRLRQRWVLPVPGRPGSRRRGRMRRDHRPAGSVRDAEVIETADRLGVALIFSTHRYFTH